jgi:2-keto-4-pentenoate hydratase/2-oxohepta-3-ene-1,7-dioic acid hydratase in catechol pathway
VRFATIVDDGWPSVALVRDGRTIRLDRLEPGFDSMRALAASGAHGLDRVRAWADRQPETAYRPIGEVSLGPVVPDPGAVYTIGLNYRPADGDDPDRPVRPLVYGKLPTSVSGDGSVVTWDRSLTANVDPEVELGVVIGQPARDVDADAAMRHVFGYTCINDISSRDEWLDGDQWLLGKSMAGFCPVGPWIVTPDEFDPADVRLGCRINRVAIQEGNTADMRFSIAAVISYLSRHTVLRPGDLIATGTPARLARPLGPDRHLEAGDVVTVWIEGIGELTTSIT